MEDLCLYQHLGCTEREVYREGRWGNGECARARVSVCALVCVCVCLSVRVHDCARMIGGVGVDNRGWSVI